MKIENENFKILYDNNQSTIFFEGTLRMNNISEFSKIEKFMLDIYELSAAELILNFHGLDFMNSAGISTLCKFILKIKDIHNKPVTIIGNNNIIWQRKTFQNLLTIWNALVIEFR